MKKKNKEYFSKRQIEKFEKARLQLIKDIDLFVSGIKFTKENYHVKAPWFNHKEFNLEWVEELRKSIYNID